MSMNRSYRSRPRFVAAKEQAGMPRPFGGAVPAVQKRFEMAQNAASKNEFPLLASLIYAAPPMVMYPPEFSSGSNVMTPGGGMVNRVYQPQEEMPRTFGEKFGNWLKAGVFA